MVACMGLSHLDVAEDDWDSGICSRRHLRCKADTSKQENSNEQSTSSMSIAMMIHCVELMPRGATLAALLFVLLFVLLVSLIRTSPECGGGDVASGK